MYTLRWVSLWHFHVCVFWSYFPPIVLPSPASDSYWVLFSSRPVSVPSPFVSPFCDLTSFVRVAYRSMDKGLFKEAWTIFSPSTIHCLCSLREKWDWDLMSSLPLHYRVFTGLIIQCRSSGCVHNRYDFKAQHLSCLEDATTLDAFFHPL